MPDEPQEETRAPRGEERRGTDRRSGDRRGRERRRPPPLWRRPWALVSYGVLGALAAVLLWNRATGGGTPTVDEEPVAVAPDSAMQVVDTPTPAGVEDAFGPEGFQRLVVGGEGSVGRVVRAELFCGNASNFTIIQGHPVPRSVAGLVQEGRVGAAECKWGERSGGQSRPDFLLLIPPDLADDFASAPVVSDNYVERRRLVAELEWVGRSETLALRTGGVFRGRAR